jgi:hypothetical protein
VATESELRRYRACFTGHRPHKLHQPESVVIAALEEKIREAIDDGFVTFISGMAWGVDIWAAEIVLRLKTEDTRFTLLPWFLTKALNAAGIMTGSAATMQYCPLRIL